MESYNVKCILHADSLTGYSEKDMQILRENFEPFESPWKGNTTFCCFIEDKPFEVLMNQYRIPDHYNWNRDYASEMMGLDEYLTVEEIKQLQFYEYEDEHIYRIYNPEHSTELFVCCSAKDVNLVSKKLAEYLSNTEEAASRLDKKHIKELQKLELLSSIGSKYNADFLLIPSHL